MISVVTLRQLRIEAPAQRPPAPVSGARLVLLRVEHTQAEYLERHGHTLHGAVILGRHVPGPWPEGDDDPPTPKATTPVQPPRPVAVAAREHGVPHLHDPDTWVLPFLTSRENRNCSRAPLMRSAQSIPVAPTPDTFGSDEVLDRFVRATAATQISTALPAAAYFQFESLSDPWLEVSLRAAASAQRLNRGGPIAVFAQVPIQALLDGTLESVAPRYAERLPGGALAFLRVAGFDPQDAHQGDPQVAYLRAVAAWRAVGLEPFADRVGRFGIVALGAGARGMAAGSRVYRMLPPGPFWENPFSVKVPHRYQAPDRMDSLPAREALDRRDRLPRCPVQDCDALRPGSDLVERLRVHHDHLLQAEAFQVESGEFGTILEAMRHSPRNYVRAWAASFDEATRLSASM